MLIDFDYVVAKRMISDENLCGGIRLVSGNNYNASLYNVSILSWDIKINNENKGMAIMAKDLTSFCDIPLRCKYNGEIFESDNYALKKVSMNVDLAKAININECWEFVDEKGRTFRGVVNKIVNIKYTSTWDSCDVVLRWCINIEDCSQHKYLRINSVKSARRLSDEDRINLLKHLEFDCYDDEMNDISITLAPYKEAYYDKIIEMAKKSLSNCDREAAMSKMFSIGVDCSLRWTFAISETEI